MERLTRERTGAIVVAAGRGERLGAPKQFLTAGSIRLVDHAVAAAAVTCDEVVVVLPANQSWDGVEVWAAVVGGETRADSVRAGLAALSMDIEIVVVHDAARPLASPELFTLVIDVVRSGADAAVPAIPVADTLKRVVADQVIETVDRAGLAAVQTPQAFRSSVLRRAHEEAPNATDDAGLVEAVGGRVVVVAGDARNIKVTTLADVAIVEALMAEAGQ